MGRLGQSGDMQTHQIGGSTFQFSAARIENLGASEYTLVVVAVDVSSSLGGLGGDLDKLLGAIVEACRKSPRADNIMLRVLMFNRSVSEFHGFRPLPDLNPSDYDGSCNPSGTTALYDAAYSGIESCIQYGADLVAQDFDVNAAVFVLTDGQDNESKTTPRMIKDALAGAVKSEAIESIMPVLIGIGDGATADVSDVSPYLDRFHKEAGFQQYVYAGNADAATLAKIAGFVSKSVSSQSQSLCSGGVSTSLSFS